MPSILQCTVYNVDCSELVLSFNRLGSGLVFRDIGDRQIGSGVSTRVRVRAKFRGKALFLELIFFRFCLF